MINIGDIHGDNYGDVVIYINTNKYLIISLSHTTLFDKNQFIHKMTRYMKSYELKMFYE